MGFVLAVEWCEPLQLLILCMVDRSIRLLKIEGIKYGKLILDELRFEDAAERGPNCCYRCPFLVKNCISAYSPIHGSTLLLLQGNKHYMLVKLPSMEVISKYMTPADTDEKKMILDVPRLRLHAPAGLKERPNTLMQMIYSANGLFVFFWQGNAK